MTHSHIVADAEIESNFDETLSPDGARQSLISGEIFEKECC